jgi:hypothetical protein
MDNKTHKTLLEIREAIAAQVEHITKPYSDTIINLNLQMARDKFGEEIKNKFIDEFDLEKHGWRKDSEQIKRFGQYDFQKPLI